NHVADHAFGLRAEHVQRVGAVRVVGGALQSQQPDLRAVAVGDHQLVAGRHQRDLAAGKPHVLALPGGRAGFAAGQQGGGSQGYDDAHPYPPFQISPRVATSTALMVCMRFSAWSKVMHAGDSNTSSVTSMPPASCG